MLLSFKAKVQAIAPDPKDATRVIVRLHVIDAVWLMSQVAISIPENEVPLIGDVVEFTGACKKSSTRIA